MKIIFILLTFNLGWVDAQEYLQLTDDELAYDVEIIVFGRNLDQRSSTSLNNRSTELNQLTQSLFENTENLPLFKPTEKVLPEESTQPDGENWQVPLGDEKVNMMALVWLYISQSMDHPIIDRLNNNPTIKPLFYQKWRQPATAFLSPEYVSVTGIKNKVESLIEEPANQINNVTTFDQGNVFQNNELAQARVHADFSFDGVVSFSKQRFTHFQVKMNYFRLDNEGHQLIYNMDQKTRIELAQWQYFDHQQFGVLAKVVAVESLKNEEAQ